ncbi:hypothetical protein GGX14DRAFT_369305, partial [Mycena pura]
VWKLYMVQAKLFDDNLGDVFNSDLDSLLIFGMDVKPLLQAALFSAILAAFLIEIRKGLQEDLQTNTNMLLTILIKNLHNSTSPQIPTSTGFEPSSSTVWVNGLWFPSLMFSLMSALGASLAKGWVTQFASPVSGSSWSDAKLHCSRYLGLKRWHLRLIIQCLPILIHIAFFLFSIGLVILLFQDNSAIFITVCILTVLVGSFYIGSTLHAVYFSDSPFRTPLSDIFQRLFKGASSHSVVTVFSDCTDLQKAQALCWLLTESQDIPTIHAAICRKIRILSIATCKHL